MFQSKFSKKNSAKEVKTVRQYRCYYRDGSVTYGTEIVSESKSVCKEVSNYSWPQDACDGGNSSSPRLEQRPGNNQSLATETEAVIEVNHVNRTAALSQDDSKKLEDPAVCQPALKSTEHLPESLADDMTNNTEKSSVFDSKADEDEPEGFQKISDSLENVAKRLPSRRRLSDVSSDDLVSRAHSDESKFSSRSNSRSRSCSERSNAPPGSDDPAFRSSSGMKVECSSSEQRNYVGGTGSSLSDRGYFEEEYRTESRDSQCSALGDPSGKRNSCGFRDYGSSDSEFDIFCAKRRWSRRDPDPEAGNVDKISAGTVAAAKQAVGIETKRNHRITAVDANERDSSTFGMDACRLLSSSENRRRVSFTRSMDDDGEELKKPVERNKGTKAFFTIHPWDRRRHWSDSTANTARETSPVPRDGTVVGEQPTEEDIELLVPDEPPKRTPSASSCARVEEHYPKCWSYSCESCFGIFAGKRSSETVFVHPKRVQRSLSAATESSDDNCCAPRRRKHSDVCVGGAHSGCGFPCVKEMVEFFDKKALEYQCRLSSTAAKRSKESIHKESKSQDDEEEVARLANGRDSDVEDESTTSYSDSDSIEDDTNPSPAETSLAVNDAPRVDDAEYYDIVVAEDVKQSPDAGNRAGGLRWLWSSFTFGESTVIISLQMFNLIAVGGAIVYALYYSST